VVQGHLEDLAAPFLLSDRCSLTRSTVALLGRLITSIVGDNCIDSLFEDLVHTGHLLAAALHISCSHLPSYIHPLLLSDGRQSLGFEEIDACALCSEI
jgi:hypothetical protein